MYLEIHREDGSVDIREMGPGIFSVGRDRDNQIVVSGQGVEGRHAILSMRAGSCWIEDLGTREGTRVGGVPVSGRSEVLEGQEIQISRTVVKVFSQRPRLETLTVPVTHQGQSQS